MSTQSSLNLKSQDSGPVECLGQSFASDEARREYYLKLLAGKLKDPEFRKIDGFPIGEDEDILALSDPPYYTACPNPWIGEFIKCYGRPYDPNEKYHREPFASDVGEGKYHPIYKLHPYPTKVPHRAIMRYILHYTEPKDIVFDGFAGTGMTGVAARLCGDKQEVESLGYTVTKDGRVLNSEMEQVSLFGSRIAAIGDLSPVATYIESAANTSIQETQFEQNAREVINKVENKHGWMFATIHSSEGEDISKASNCIKRCKSLSECREYVNELRSNFLLGRINYAAWSDVFTCPECGGEIVYWRTCVDQKSGKVRERFNCPHCSSSLTKRNLLRVMESVFDMSLSKTVTRSKQVVVKINYSFGKKRFEKEPDSFDSEVVSAIERMSIEDWHPTNPIIVGDKTSEPIRLGITNAHQFYSIRNLACLSAFRNECSGRPDLLFVITKLAFQITKLYRYTYMSGVWGAGGGPLSGTLYIPSLYKELNVLKQMASSIQGRLAIQQTNSEPRTLITTGSCSWTGAPSNSFDYLFFDPPFGSNLMYSELNFLQESWLKVFAQKDEEAIENNSQNKALKEYRQLMVECFREAFRILKPGRWMTVEFSNTQASVWNSIQSALQEAGFVVANVSMLDKLKGTFNAANNPTSVKQDLVISAYKANGGLEERFATCGGTSEGVWDFVATHLRNLPVTKIRGGQLEPIAERDPRILYDRMVAFYVGHSTPVPLSSAEFQAGLAERFVERDEKFFLREQVPEWDSKRAKLQRGVQMSIFVEDEKSAIDWLRNSLKIKPSTIADIVSEFLQQLNASWKKFETRPELSDLLELNFLKYDGKGEVPSQIHSYLSTQNKDLRNLPKDDARLQARAKDRWYVPDPSKAMDVEKIRNKRLLQEFWELCDQAGIARPKPGDPNQARLPISTPVTAKKTGRKKLKEVRSEAVRLGFRECFAAKDYGTILAIAEHLPNNVIEEDEQLQMMHDMAVMRTEG